jgi:pantoate--beta-alanine ligase
VTKLFNIVQVSLHITLPSSRRVSAKCVFQPTRAYFGQKDIQQALILRRLVRDLLLDHPLPENLIIVPTHRAPLTAPTPSSASSSKDAAQSSPPTFSGGLALSSRNAYLTPSEASYAPTLYAALRLAQSAWESGSSSAQSAVALAESHIAQRSAEARERDGVDVRLDYVTIVDPETFELADWKQSDEPRRTALVVGAMFVGRTRLIDNILSGDVSGILGGDQKAE